MSGDWNQPGTRPPPAVGCVSIFAQHGIFFLHLHQNVNCVNFKRLLEERPRKLTYEDDDFNNL